MKLVGLFSRTSSPSRFLQRLNALRQTSHVGLRFFKASTSLVTRWVFRETVSRRENVRSRWVLRETVSRWENVRAHRVSVWLWFRPNPSHKVQLVWLRTNGRIKHSCLSENGFSFRPKQRHHGWHHVLSTGRGHRRHYGMLHIRFLVVT